MTDAATPHPVHLGMPLPFERAEYARRLEAARRRLADEKLDALLLFHQESMYYLFGYDQLGYWVYQAAVLTPDKLVVVARRADHDLINGLPFIDELRLWRDDSADDPVDITGAVLRDLGIGPAARVGIELRSHALLPYYYGRLQSALHEAMQLTDASDLITELRLRKSDAEIVYVREAGRVVDAAYAGAFGALRPGVTETEVLGASFVSTFRAGGHVPAIVPPLASGPRTLARTHGAAVDRVVQEGEPFQFEVGGCRHRYHAVGVQTKWVGTPAADVKAAYGHLLEALQAGREATRAGARTADVARAVNRTLIAHGVNAAGNHVGYGTGIGYPPTWLDNLRLKETDTHVLEANMVFFMFAFRTFNAVELFVGEPILVTAAGCERLTTTPLSLELGD